MTSSKFMMGVLVSGAFHVLAYVQMRHAKASVKHVSAPVLIELESSPATPPEAQPETERASENPAPKEPASARTAKPDRAAQSREAPSPAAQAGRVLAASEDTPAVADFTIVEGAGATFAGGITSHTGTARDVVTRPPHASDGLGPAGDAGGPRSGYATGNRSKTARPMGSDWDCSLLFPRGASTDSATVILVARVRPNGLAESVSVVSDPGQGFGAAARACAMRQRYAPGEDETGRAVAATTAPFRVRFTR